MHSHHSPDHHVHTPHRCIPRQGQLRVVLTLEPHGAGFHHRHPRLEGLRPHFLQPSDFELVDVRCNEGCACVDGFAELVGRELPAEDARGLGVEDAVFVAGRREVVGGEHYVGRVEGQVIELGEGGEIGDGIVGVCAGGGSWCDC